RRSWSGHKRAARRDERSWLGHFLGIKQVDPWWVALPRTRGVPPGSRSAERTRSALAHGAASGAADALHVAADDRLAFGAFAALRSHPVRPARRSEAVAGFAHGRSHPPRSRSAAETHVSLWLRVLG